jgi:hypothetical protein
MTTAAKKGLRGNRPGGLPMTEIATNASDYSMGHNERERHRLSAQAAILAPITEQLLRRAGVGSGMRIVDFGCGGSALCSMSFRISPFCKQTHLSFAPTLRLMPQHILARCTSLTGAE